MDIKREITFHEKAVKILELIEKCKRMQLVHAQGFTGINRSWEKKRFDINKAMEKRLNNYYANHLKSHIV